MCSALVSNLNVFAYNNVVVDNIKRPLGLENYIGQDVIKEQLKIKINLFFAQEKHYLIHYYWVSQELVKQLWLRSLQMN